MLDFDLNEWMPSDWNALAWVRKALWGGSYVPGPWACRLGEEPQGGGGSWVSRSPKMSARLLHVLFYSQNRVLYFKTPVNPWLIDWLSHSERCYVPYIVMERKVCFRVRHVGTEEKDKCKKHLEKVTSRTLTLIWWEQWKRRVEDSSITHLDKKIKKI